MTHMSYVKDIKSRRHQHLSDAETAERSQKNLWPQNSWLQGEARGPVACWPLARERHGAHKIQSGSREE